MNKRWSCVGFGLCAFDSLAVVEHYPARNEKVEAIAFSQQGGGPVATALATLGRLGVPDVAFVGKIGDDREGKIIRTALARDGVSVQYLRVVPRSHSAQAFVWVEKNSGERSVVLYRDERLLFHPDEIDSEPFVSARYLLIDGRDTEAALRAVSLARGAGTTIIMDAGSMRPKIEDFLPLVDYFICSRDFLQAFAHDSALEPALEKIHGFGGKGVVVTLGEKGSAGYDGLGFVHEPGWSVPVMDTTGAGDVYHGAFIFGLLQKWRFRECMRFANAVAALKCTRLGGRAGIPDRKRLKTFYLQQADQQDELKPWLESW